MAAQLLPTRYLAFAVVVIAFLASGVLLAMGFRGPHWIVLFLASGFLTSVGIRDVTQTRQSIRRNYPLLSHFRFFFEEIRPEIRQYFVESDVEEIPFSRQQRNLVYQRAKNALDTRPFGTMGQVYQPGYEWINHSMRPTHIPSQDFRIQIGGPDCTQRYSASVFNISAMSYGALSPNAILALNTGAKRGGFFHDTGEGSISRFHREPGGDLVWNVGSGYFGCRNDDGSFSPERFRDNACLPQVRMIELKLSQGAKPGHGGVLPAAKVSPEISAARGVPMGIDCISPASHPAFSTPIEMMEFIAKLRDLAGGKPVGFKIAIGHPWEWFAVAKAMVATGITPDFIVVDGAEGGTGAAPVEFIDHVGAPLREALLLVHNTLVGLNLRGRIRIGAAGKVVSAFDIARTIALGADWCNAARAFMFAVGCIQAQTCHTGTCPTGVTTQDPNRYRALVVEDKATRVANYHRNTMRALHELLEAAGLDHPDQLGPEHVIRRMTVNEVRSLASLYHFVQPGELVEGTPDHAVFKMFWHLATPEQFRAPPSMLSLRTTKMR